LIGLLLVAVYPFAPFIDWLAEGMGVPSLNLDRQLVGIFIFAIVVLALNVQVGYAGLLQLGISAFFAIGAYAAGLLTVGKYPFQLELWAVLVLAPLIAGCAGLLLGAPTLRLRGDYLALVTLGFAEVVRVVLLNLESITDGPRGLNPLPSPWVPKALDDALSTGGAVGRPHFVTMYYTALLCLCGLVVLLKTLERSPLGRAFVALREDELASACMGVNPMRTKLVAFAIGAAMAGLAGALYATNLTTTAEPNTYDFNFSIMVLCCVIIGGLGSVRGAVLGAAVLVLFDSVVSPLISRALQNAVEGSAGNVLLTFSNWRWLIFGTALVVMMRLRPEGLWPSARVQAELHEQRRIG
jgi:branched-chain amino acid transport system permease protein